MSDKKIVLITGSSSGIGYETALLFARKGHSVYAGVRNKESNGAKNLLELQTKENLQIQLVTLDVCVQEHITKVVKAIIDKEGVIDVLVNNAGFGFLGPIELFNIDEVKEQYETNVFGVLRMVHEVIPHMRKQQSGAIISLSSINGLVPFPLYGIYCSSKYALEGLMRTLRFELKTFGLNVALIEPGKFQTQFFNEGKYPAEMNNEASPYKKYTDHFFSKRKSFNNLQFSLAKNLMNPNRVAQRIYTVSCQQNPSIRNIVGLDARLLYMAHSILPEKIMYWIYKKIYKWT